MWIVYRTLFVRHRDIFIVISIEVLHWHWKSSQRSTSIRVFAGLKWKFSER